MGKRRRTEDGLATIQDVANRAGVSISTVSRVINKTVTVEPATEERVRDAILALNYRPNLLARSFRRRVTHTIGLIVPDNSNPFFAEIARVIENAGFAEGYSVILGNSDLSEEKQAAYVDVLLAKQVDGLIVTSSGLIPNENGHDVTERIFASGVPWVAVDRDLGHLPVDQVLVDNDRGGYEAGQYLLGLGHRQFAAIVGPSDLTPSAGRVAGFLLALRDAGITLPHEAMVRANGRHDGGVTATAELLNRDVEFTAVFAFNDLVAIGVIGALQRAGRRVPDDVSVLGFDDVPQAASFYPAVTTVSQPIAEMGRTSLRLLLDRIERRDAPYQRIVLNTTIVERESCRAIRVSR